MQRLRTITVGIAAPEVLRRSALSRILSGAQDVVIAGEAGGGAAAVELARYHRPRVLLMDAALPGPGAFRPGIEALPPRVEAFPPGMDGFAAARLVRREAPDTQVLMLADSTNGELLFPALLAGVAGLLPRDSEPSVLVNGVRAVAAGDAVLPPSAIRCLVDRGVCDCAERRDRARRRISILTVRERDVLVHLSKGMSNAGIARAMYLSEGAVKAHISKLLAKLRCDNRVQAALIGRDAGLAG